MLKKVLGLLVLGLVLASCGTPVPTGGLKDVKSESADNAVTVKWTFDGDKATIKGFRVLRNQGGDSTSYAKLGEDILNVNATSYSDTDVLQGETFKYGIAVIKKDGSIGTTINQTGAAVGPKTSTTKGSMNGKWTLDAVITAAPPGEEGQIGNKFYFFLDIVEASGQLTGTVNFRDPDLSPPIPGGAFGESKVEGNKNPDGSYTFKLIEVSPTTTTIGKFWTVTATVNAGSTAYTGTYVNVFNFEGTVTGVKVP
jgi:hypothetical protein